MLKPTDLFDLTQTEHAAVFDGVEYAWEALKRLKEYLRAHLRPGLRNQCEGVAWIGAHVFIGEGTVVEDGAMIKGPAIIGRNCRIRHNAYLREDVIIGDNCVVGNSSELKTALLFNGAQVPHFNYVGDSILGMFVGRRRSLTSSLSKASSKRQMTERAKLDIEESEAEIDKLNQEIAEIQQALEDASAEATERWNAAVEKVEQFQVRPRKSDVKVRQMAVAWTPHWQVTYADAGGAARTEVLSAV